MTLLRTAVFSSIHAAAFHPPFQLHYRGCYLLVPCFRKTEHAPSHSFLPSLSLSRVSLSLRFLSRLASTAPFLIFWIHAGLEGEAKEAPMGLKRGRGIAEPNQGEMNPLACRHFSRQFWFRFHLLFWQKSFACASGIQRFDPLILGEGTGSCRSRILSCCYGALLPPPSRPLGVVVTFP